MCHGMHAPPDVQVDCPVWQGVRHWHADLTNAAIEDLAAPAVVDGHEPYMYTEATAYA